MPRIKRRRYTKPIWAEDVYHMAYGRAQGAAWRAGHGNLTPSLAEKQDYKYAWSDFMRGWYDGIDDWYKETNDD